MHTSQMWPIRSELILLSVAWRDQEYFYLPLSGMLVHHKVTPRIKFAGTHLYIWVERGTVRVQCLAQEHNTMSPARARTQTTFTNHEATMTLKGETWVRCICSVLTRIVFRWKHGLRTMFLCANKLPRKTRAHVTAVHKQFTIICRQEVTSIK